MQIPHIFSNHQAFPGKLELDELILTYGWRKFTWEKVLGDEQLNPDYLAEIRAPLLSGHFVEGDSLQGKTLMALFPGKEPQLYTFELGDDNDFNFEISPEIKSGDILFWSDETDLKNYELELDTYFEKADSALFEKQLTFDQEMLDFIQEYAIGIQVDNSYALENNSRG